MGQAIGSSFKVVQGRQVVQIQIQVTCHRPQWDLPKQFLRRCRPWLVVNKPVLTFLLGEVGQPLFRSHDKIPRRIRFSICPLDALVWADTETVDRQTDSQEIGSYRLSQQT